MPETSSDYRVDQIARTPVSFRWKDLITDAWRHQAAAVTFAARYLQRREDNRDKAALIRMPTGTGKTGIMAILCNYFATFDHILIVAPAEFLTGQICDALNFDFWLKLKKKPPGGPKRALSFLPSTLGSQIEELAGSPAVFVCTTQTLFMLYDEFIEPSDGAAWSSAYRALAAQLDLVLVDEGHREPAKEWAKAVRSFAKPTVLFSATPYRNDLRFFRVGRDKCRHKFTFPEAVQRRIIRNVAFVDAKFAGNPNEFVDCLLKFFRGQFKSSLPAGINDPKVIVRCEHKRSLAKIKSILAKKNQNVLAVHDTFNSSDKENNNFHSVPRHHDATFWVHQNKLAEGLDDPNFCLIAFFEPFGNARGLVQQVGRVLRSNPELNDEQTAFVFSDPVHGLREQWNGYLGFENSARSIVGPEEVVENFLHSLPDWFYSHGRYRHPATLDDHSLQADVRVPKSAVIYRVAKEFGKEQLIRLVEDVSDSLADREIVELKKLPCRSLKGGYVMVLLSCRIVQPDALSEEGFFDISFIPSVFYLHREYLFYQCVLGPPTRPYERVLTPIRPSEMQRLLGPAPTITQLSVVNCDLGNTSVRRRALGARSINAVAPGLNDHFHVVSTAVGSFERDGNKTRRYLGLSRSRLTQAAQAYADLDEFAAWAVRVVEQLADDSRKVSPVFVRFAKNVLAPRESYAKHLLLDLVEFFQIFDSDKEVFEDTFEATACEVNDDGDFECKITETETIHGTVTYDTTRKKFTLVSDDLDELISEANTSSESRRQTASSYLSNRPVMRIITHEYQLYADGHFYEPRQPLWGEGRLENLGILIPIPELQHLTAEKGTKGLIGRGTWQTGSIFRFIDRENLLFNEGELRPSLLVCDDLATEIADFIAVDRRVQKVAVIHAKMWSAESSLSAKDFQIVNSQLTKSLEFLNPLGSVAPSHGRKWNGRWKWFKNAPPSRSLARIRHQEGSHLSGEEIFAEVQQRMKTSSTQKEVWVVLGGGFSISALNAQLSDSSHPPYHVVQLVYLLQSCNSSVNSVGASLKVFSSP